MDNLANLIILPSNLMIWMTLAALLLFFIRRKRLSSVCAAGALLIYFVFACGPVSHFLLSRLEYQYPMFHPEFSPAPSVTTIVLLTGSSDPKLETPISSHPNSSSAYRILETAYIHRFYPQSRILVTGYGTTPQTLKDNLVALGIDEQQIIIDDHSNNTFESAHNLATDLASQRFLLVTSAGHMPRAMAVFRAQNLDPIPAPTEFKTRENILAAQYLPTPRHMVYADLAIHEYVGILWYKLSGKL